MTYVVRGLDPAPFQPLFGLGDDELAKRGVVRMTVSDVPDLSLPGEFDRSGDRRDPCFFSITSVTKSPTPIGRATRSSSKTQGEDRAASMKTRSRRLFERRTLALRGFDTDGMLKGALLAMPGEADARIRELFDARNRHHPCAQCGAWLLPGADRKELTMASLAPLPGRDRPAAVNDRHPPRSDDRLGRVQAPRPELGRARHRRGQDDRHLLQAELPGAAAQARECRILRRAARRRARPAIAPACAASPTRWAATRGAGKGLPAARGAEEAPSLDELAAAVGYSPHHFHRLFKRDPASLRPHIRAACAAAGPRRR